MQIIIDTISANKMPPKKPAQVLDGLIDGANLKPPINLPKK